jgi:hypothetical protein
MPENEQTKKQIHALASHGFEWRLELEPLRKSVTDLSSTIDLPTLAKQAEIAEREGTICITLLSQEYLDVGAYWLHAMQRLNLKNVLVIAGDDATQQALAAHRIAVVRAYLEKDSLGESFRNIVGFSWKGLGLATLKLPVARFLLGQGYDVVVSDADALWLQNPFPHFHGIADVAFQRAVYFPAPIARLWGFAACTGFFYCRAKPATAQFLDYCLTQAWGVQDDQVAMNLALLQADAEWPHVHEIRRPLAQEGSLPPNIQRSFKLLARRPLHGMINHLGLQLLALPHHQFWRHDEIVAPLSEMVVCHPNSPKVASEKINVFNALGIQLRQ